MTPRQAERTEATRAALVEAATRLFAERGFAGVGTQEVVAAAGVSRGALYHHFADKRDLFRAVHEAAEQRVADAIAARLARARDPSRLLEIGLDAFLETCLDPTFARIALNEAPSVLGWEEWREIDERYGLGLVRLALEADMASGGMPRQPVEPLSHVLLGALTEAGMVIAHAEDPRAARRRMRRALGSLLAGLRAG